MFNFRQFLIGTLALGFSVSGHATQLVHRYEFTNGGADSVGTADGTLVNGAFVSDGMLNLSASTGTGFGAAALSLPATVASGLGGSFSIETWYTLQDTSVLYSTLFAFSNGGADRDYGTGFLIAVPYRRSDEPYASAGFKVAETNPEILLTGVNSPSFSLTQMVLTYESSTSLASIYLGGVLMNSVTVTTGFDLSLMTMFRVGGGSTFSDSSLNGTITDFRLYNGVLTPNTVSALFSAGADASNAAIFSAVPEPSSYAAGTGALLAAVIFLRRRRLATHR